MVLLGGKRVSRVIGAADLICEGESDLATGLSLGYPGIGTPGTGQCAEEVARYYAARPAVVPCIVGDADADGAGQRGAERLAGALLAGGTPCRVLIAPDEYHDLRGWLTKGGLTPALLAEAVGARPIRWPDDAARGFFLSPNWTVKRRIIAHVGPTAWAVYCAIGSFADGDGRCWPDREQVAALVGVSVKTVGDALSRLREAKLLNWRRGGTKRANEYQIMGFREYRKCKSATQTPSFGE